jgi:hypothetical protein
VRWQDVEVDVVEVVQDSHHPIGITRGGHRLVDDQYGPGTAEHAGRLGQHLEAARTCGDGRNTTAGMAEPAAHADFTVHPYQEHWFERFAGRH